MADKSEQKQVFRSHAPRNGNSKLKDAKTPLKEIEILSELRDIFLWTIMTGSRVIH